MFNTLKTMFWAIFFIGNSNAAMIKPFENLLTPVVGYFIIIVFNIITITVLINMLIASMVLSYTVILVSNLIKHNKIL